MTQENKTYGLNILVANFVATKKDYATSFVFVYSFVNYTIK
jgi:hypothetical protein